MGWNGGMGWKRGRVGDQEMGREREDWGEEWQGVGFTGPCPDCSKGVVDVGVFGQKQCPQTPIVGERFSGSFETLIKLSNEGLGMTLLPYLHTLDLQKGLENNLHYFNEPSPAREVSIIYSKSELKMQIINALFDVISGVIRGAIAFQDVKIISPKAQKN